jgi:hypothetical protein
MPIGAESLTPSDVVTTISTTRALSGNPRCGRRIAASDVARRRRRAAMSRTRGSRARDDGSGIDKSVQQIRGGGVGDVAIVDIDMGT